MVIGESKYESVTCNFFYVVFSLKFRLTISLPFVVDDKSLKDIMNIWGNDYFVPLGNP